MGGAIFPIPVLCDFIPDDLLWLMRNNRFVNDFVVEKQHTWIIFTLSFLYFRIIEI